MSSSVVVDATLRGARHESSGMEADAARAFPTAIVYYNHSLVDLGEAIAAGKKENHPDVSALEKHRTEIEERIQHLQSLEVFGIER